MKKNPGPEVLTTVLSFVALLFLVEMLICWGIK